MALLFKNAIQGKSYEWKLIFPLSQENCYGYHLRMFGDNCNISFFGKVFIVELPICPLSLLQIIGVTYCGLLQLQTISISSFRVCFLAQDPSYEPQSKKYICPMRFKNI